MTFKYLDSVDNVFCIDTMFFGFPRFNSAYLVKGRDKIALIDTGAPSSFDYVKKGIEGLGIAVEDIDYIFVTHCEHPDHSGNIGALLQLNQKARVLAPANGVEYLLHPEIEAAVRASNLLPQMAARFGVMTPVSEDRIDIVSGGEVFDLGGDTLRITIAPGHQPSGYVVSESKNRILFINDIIGQYFAETDVSMILTPDRAEVLTMMESLNKIKDFPCEWLAMGHYGFSDNPAMVIGGALIRMQRLIDIGEMCVREGRHEQLEDEIWDRVVLYEIEKLRLLCDSDYYEYYREELGPNLCRGFSKYFRSLKGIEYDKAWRGVAM